MVKLLWKKVWRFLEKLKIELPYNSACCNLNLSTTSTKIELFFFFFLDCNVTLPNSMRWQRESFQSHRSESLTFPLFISFLWWDIKSTYIFPSCFYFSLSPITYHWLPEFCSWKQHPWGTQSIKGSGTEMENSSFIHSVYIYWASPTSLTLNPVLKI